MLLFPGDLLRAWGGTTTPVNTTPASWHFKLSVGIKPSQSSGAVCESRDGRPGFPVPNSPYGLCGRKATLIVQELCESRGGRPGQSVLTSLLVSVDAIY